MTTTMRRDDRQEEEEWDNNEMDGLKKCASSSWSLSLNDIR